MKAPESFGQWLGNFKEIWILLGIVLIAVFVGFLLKWIGDPWSPADWASNLIFALAIAFMSALLGRRQSQLQESLADVLLLEKMAIISGATDRITRVEKFYASEIVQLLYDIRSGLQLYPFAVQNRQDEYLGCTSRSLGEINATILETTRAFTMWISADWEAVYTATEELRTTTNKKISLSNCNSINSYENIIKHLDALSNSSKQDDNIEYSVFEKSYRQPTSLGNSIRVKLNWTRLKMLMDKGSAHIVFHRILSYEFSAERKFYFAWYVKNNQFCSFDVPGSRPIKLTEINHLSSLLPPSYQKCITRMQERLERRVNGIIPIEPIVTLGLNETEAIILDGNHRIAAIFKFREGWDTVIPVWIVEYRIESNDLTGLLADLRYQH